MPAADVPAETSSDSVATAAAKATAAKPAVEKASKKAFTAKDDEPIEL
jgi:hypothetical protein